MESIKATRAMMIVASKKEEKIISFLIRDMKIVHNKVLIVSIVDGWIDCIGCE